MAYIFKDKHIIVDGVPEVPPSDVSKNLNSLAVIDVRSDEEFVGELGHIPGSILKTLGEEFDSYIKTLDANKEYVIVCRSGRRSAAATEEMRSLGFAHVYNMTGGMLLWNNEDLPIEK